MKKILLNKKILLILLSIILIIIGIVVAINVSSKIKEVNNSITGIFVNEYPYKTTYYLGEELDLEGLVIGISKKKANADYLKMDYSIFSVSGYNANKISDQQKITIYYEKYTCSIYVKVIAKPEPTKCLVGIELVKMPKTTYKVGEWLDLSSAILQLKYSDSSTAEIQIVFDHIYGYTKEMSNTPGTYTLTVKYVEKGILAETTFEITIEE